MIKKNMSQIFSTDNLVIGIIVLCMIWILFLLGMYGQQSKIKYSYVETVVDSCQYIKILGSDAWVHKGNCNNPIHQYQTEKYKEINK